MAVGSWTTAPNPWNVRALRGEIRAFAVDSGFSAVRAQDLTLAVSEIISNAVLHAYRDGSDGEIVVGAELRRDHLDVWVVDDGVGMSPRTDSPGGGMGLMIADRIADRVLIERPPAGGTSVCLSFATAA